MTEIYVKVEPDSDEFKIEKGSMPKIYLEKPAENGKANSELVRKLEEITGEKPGIISGHKSRRKKLSINMSKQKFKNKLSDV
ncbi:MAG: hypothetical protein ACI9SF_000833 [Candidatus Nanohaloarchaea archaeon]|jgi:uncharacterized protein (TIGR00251 family)